MAAKKNISRRDFLRWSAMAGAGAAFAATSPTFALGSSRARMELQADGKIVLHVVSGQDATEIDVRKQIATMFEQVNSNVDVEIDLITGARDESQTVMIAGDNPPDILYLNEWFQYPFFQKGVALPLDDYVKKDNFSFDGILPAAHDINVYKGQLLAMPFEVSPLTIVYNKKLFDDAGVDYPPTSWTDPDWTWDKLVEIATKLTDADNGQYGFSMENWMYPSVMLQTGSNVLSNTKEITADTKCVINTPEAAKAFQLLVDLQGKYAVSPSAASAQELGGFDRFMSGKVAMYCYGRWLNVFRTITDFQWDTAPLPHFDGGKPATQLFTLNYSIYTKTANPDIGWEFLKFLTTQGPQGADVASGMAVAVNESTNDSTAFTNSTPPEHNDVYKEGLQYATPNDNLDVPFTNELNAALDQIWTGDVTVEDGLQQAADAVNQVLDSWRQDNNMS
ncbi:MAG TPA: sugar ABC transporter substrate-binding protein [Phototrophicaceae bacterium]|nr:sugar ABC transporter substrate-binding protein [Phototrophicaceae bacterium]